MEEKYLSTIGGGGGGGGHNKDARTSPGPSQEQVLAWVDEVFHDLRQNKVSFYVTHRCLIDSEICDATTEPHFLFCSLSGYHLLYYHTLPSWFGRQEEAVSQ